MKKKKALVFTGGKGPTADRISWLIEETEMIIAADSGWDLAVESGAVPDIFIGDMDSVKDRSSIVKLPSEKKLIYPEDKDFTDTELAIKYLYSEGYRDIVLIGGGEGRVDHLLGIISLFSRQIRPSEWYTFRERIIFADDKMKVECENESTVSIYPCSEGCIISSRGLKWELNDYRMDRKIFSLSNMAISSSFDVSLSEGTALIIINL